MSARRPLSERITPEARDAIKRGMQEYIQTIIRAIEMNKRHRETILNLASHPSFPQNEGFQIHDVLAAYEHVRAGEAAQVSQTSTSHSSLKRAGLEHEKSQIMAQIQQIEEQRSLIVQQQRAISMDNPEYAQIHRRRLLVDRAFREHTQQLETVERKIQQFKAMTQMPSARQRERVSLGAKDVIAAVVMLNDSPPPPYGRVKYCPASVLQKYQDS
ncbi:hypothetical protein J8273_7379 [Carpediemonas membranifera]|uniref:Uncharacterized protein n=1 Tax=Carpediemonas membranifera TaxID=201153 RepID=A0A8J6E7U9_9EUKA|nr:hypothetical protein J8273_7379 [Carpediemonas membranifera]|eukprot:KAG9391105.1 hypothetical protein J8273_7379 [Carpediemonas membranifera]